MQKYVKNHSYTFYKNFNNTGVDRDVEIINFVMNVY